ncbi:microtubule-associated proteins 65-1 [Wolffia australiana]
MPLLTAMASAISDGDIFNETTCGSLLHQLQKIWDDVGESDEERDRMLMQLEQECLDVYKRKVDQASKNRALLLQSLADSRSTLVNLYSALGESSDFSTIEKSHATIKEQLAAVTPVLEELKKLKEERAKKFSDVISEIQKIKIEINGGLNSNKPPVFDDGDLSLKKLDQFHSHLQELQKEKSERLHKVLDFVNMIHNLCGVLGMDFYATVTEVHPSLTDSAGVRSKSISDDTLSKLAMMVLSLQEEKASRLRKLQALSAQLIDLWNLMDTPENERGLFNHVTCNISAEVNKVNDPKALALDIVEQAQMEVERLDQLKTSRMKEIAFKKQAELEEIYGRAHIEVDSVEAQERIMSMINAGNVEPSELFADMDNQISTAREEALGRKEILEKVDRWMSACEEESWLEDYNRDENRYSSSRGAHLNLKRAEKARVLVNKIPALVDNLVAKTRTWEEEHGMAFVYDGVPLLAMLDEYIMLRQDREEEKKRLRDQKKYNEQLNAEQESIFGSRPSPSPGRPLGPKKIMGPRANGTPTKRLSLHNGGPRSAAKDSKRDNGSRLSAPANYVAISKDDSLPDTP